MFGECFAKEHLFLHLHLLGLSSSRTFVVRSLYCICSYLEIEPNYGSRKFLFIDIPFRARHASVVSVRDMNGRFYAWSLLLQCLIVTLFDSSMTT